MGKKIQYPEGIQYPDLKNKIGVYVVTNIINGMQYIGQSRNILKRWYDHRTKAMHPRKECEFRSVFYQAIREYGIENFYIEILEECAVENLKDREVYWINKLGTFYHGYNNDFGGDLPCYTKEHHMTDHGMAKLTLGDVKMCRHAYKNGLRARDVYNKYFANKITWNGFGKMWHGKTWKTVMPEVFKENPHPSQKVTQEQIADIRARYSSGERICSICKTYEGILSHTTITNIVNYKTYKDGIHYKSDVSTIPQGSTQSIDTIVETGVPKTVKDSQCA